LPLVSGFHVYHIRAGVFRYEAREVGRASK